MPQHHELRMRAYYVDDKHGSIRGYVDYVCPRSENPVVAGRDLHRSLGGGEVDDGQSYALDLRLVETLPLGDSYDRDHCSYYEPQARTVAWGGERSRSLRSRAWEPGSTCPRTR